MFDRILPPTRFLAFFSFMAGVACLLSPKVHADGLFYRLPPDGTSAKYDLTVTSEGITGTMTMSSVGTTKVDGKPARWIEVVLKMKRGDDERVIIGKLLIPEENLQAGGSPFANYAKAYVKMGERDVRQLDGVEDDVAGPLPFFLSGPIMNAKELETKRIDCALGSVECGGVAGKKEIKQGRGVTTFEFETRLNDRAPFGVVASEIQFSSKRDALTVESGKIGFKLTEIGMNATSALPDVGKE